MVLWVTLHFQSLLLGRVYQELQDQKEIPVSLELQEIKEVEVILVPLDPKAFEDIQVLQDTLAIKDHKASKVTEATTA